MAQTLIQCPKCRTALDPALLNQPELQPCPTCQTLLQVEAYPAMFRPIARGASGESAMVEGESTCFYHPAKKAVRPCDGCGRFVCGLCDCELRGQHFCPTCLEIGRKKGKIVSLENQRTLYDSIALSVALLPMLIFYFTIITAPITLYLAIRHWNSPRSLVHRTKARFIAAIIIACLQIVGWVFLIYIIVSEASRTYPSH